MEEETKKKLLQSSPKVKPHPQAREERTRSTEKAEKKPVHTHTGTQERRRWKKSKVKQLNVCKEEWPKISMLNK